MSAVGVWAELPAYRAATAELPVSARAVAHAEGALAVVDGSGRWWSAALSAIAAGAVGVVVARPERMPEPGLDELAASGAPIVVERPLLRADMAARGALEGVRPAFVTVECHAPALTTVLRDALGWGRAIADAPLVLRQAESSAHGRSLALLESPAGVAVSVVATVQAGAPGGGRIRVTAVGDRLIEVDGGVGTLRVTTSDADGRRVAPRRWESSERLALRRAIEAVATGSAPEDLEELQHDERLAGAIADRSRP